MIYDAQISIRIDQSTHRTIDVGQEWVTTSKGFQILYRAMVDAKDSFIIDRIQIFVLGYVKS